MPLSVEELRQLAVTSLARRGVPPKKAHLQADHLIEAERDWPSAGRQRLPRLLVRIDRCGSTASLRPERRCGLWARERFPPASRSLNRSTHVFQPSLPPDLTVGGTTP